MNVDRLSSYLTVATNIGVLVGLFLVLVQLRQNDANLATANQWALAQSSAAVWQVLIDNEDLARLELKVRKHEALSDVDSLRYDAYVWMRLEQVWSAYELHDRGVLSDAEWADSYAPTRSRASTYPIVANTIRNGPMPPPLKAILLERVAPRH
jgi:hypothetical protein